METRRENKGCTQLPYLRALPPQRLDEEGWNLPDQTYEFARAGLFHLQAASLVFILLMLAALGLSSPESSLHQPQTSGLSSPASTAFLSMPPSLVAP